MVAKSFVRGKSSTLKWTIGLEAPKVGVEEYEAKYYVCRKEVCLLDTGTFKCAACALLSQRSGGLGVNPTAFNTDVAMVSKASCASDGSTAETIAEDDRVLCGSRARVNVIQPYHIVQMGE
jgi:hypothetical protein